MDYDVVLKKGSFREVYYICPSCGDLSTLSGQLRECSEGGLPYCYCEFGGDSGRIFVGYKRISKKLWGELMRLKAGNLRLERFKQQLKTVRPKPQYALSQNL